MTMQSAWIAYLLVRTENCISLKCGILMYMQLFHCYRFFSPLLCHSRIFYEDQEISCNDFL
jgi:hypothetical protein